ncbi:hypothetical protein C8R43DRAFT_985403 [Mycena crocata]|nr:hypothetical protein C8R43DRAFT_985403 [Mycena crocata]
MVSFPDKDFTRQLASSGSSILILPPEIVSEIFLCFLPPYPDRPPFAGLLSPLLLCQICRHWRLISLSTPNLWQAITIRTSSPSIRYERHTELLQHWLSRARASPFSVSLQCLRPEMIAIIVAYCGQWEDVEIEAPFHCLPLNQGDMPLLRRLRISAGVFPYQDTGVEVTIFDRAPCPSHVVLAVSFSPSVVRLPGAQITHLEAHVLPEHECTQILGQMTNLIRMLVFPASGSHDVFTAPHTLPFLRGLTLLASTTDMRYVSLKGIWSVWRYSRFADCASVSHPSTSRTPSTSSRHLSRAQDVPLVFPTIRSLLVSRSFHPPFLYHMCTDSSALSYRNRATITNTRGFE